MPPPHPTPPTHRDILRWRTHPTTTPPPFLKYRSSTTFILLTITTAVFTDIFLYALIVPVIPFALTARAHTPPSLNSALDLRPPSRLRCMSARGVACVWLGGGSDE